MTNPQQIQNLPADQVYQALGTSRHGLNDAEAAERLREIGSNSIEVRDRWRVARSLLRQFTNFFTLLLFVSAGICLFAEQVQPGGNMFLLGITLAGVAFLNACFSFIQEYRAERAMEALRQFLPSNISVMRQGKVSALAAEQLVPGDLLLLAEGDRIPADCRVVEAEQLLVNNAPLTGEAQPVGLSSEPSELRLTDSPNIAFAGCLVLRGNGRGVVISTGLRTEFGKLAHMAQAIRRTISPLERQTAHMVRTLTVIAVSLGTLFFVYGVASGRPLWINLVFVMGIIVANVPEGLLPTFTLALALGSMRMARKNVLVKSLNAVEALGATQVICTDKTGTLTLNQLAVTRVFTSLAQGEDAPPDTAERILRQALCASEVRCDDDGFHGDPLDVSIAKRLSLASDELERFEQDRHNSFPFDVEKKRSAGICTLEGVPCFVVKGAWEVLRPMLHGLSDGAGQVLPATPEALDQADVAMRACAAEGLRVVAIAARNLPEQPGPDSQQETFEEGLTLTGFIGVTDQLRPEVPAALDRCRSAGIRVILITGDHPDTALAVAAQCGIVADRQNPDVVLTGDVLEETTEAELTAALEDGIQVFARTSPAQKMKIVMALKNMDRVVAMTGDGVNDAPALKAADIGIAMGRSGTDVARSAAHIVLLDDNFASIVSGIEEGRTVFQNIRKFTNYVLVSNGPEIIPYLLYIMLPVPLALNVIQILAIDLGTDIVPSMALGQEPPDPDVMVHPPRNPSARLLTPGLVVHSYLFLGLIEAGWSLFLFFFVLLQGGWSYGMELGGESPLYRSATGIALSTILLMQIGNLVGRRYRTRSGLDAGLLRNQLLLAGIIIQVVFSWGLLYMKPLQTILGTGPVDFSVYLLAWLGIPLLFGADYLRKKLWSLRDKPSAV